MPAPLLVQTSHFLSFLLTNVNAELSLPCGSSLSFSAHQNIFTIDTRVFTLGTVLPEAFLCLKPSEEEKKPKAIGVLVVRESHTCFCGSAGAHDGEARGISKGGTTEPGGSVFPFDSRSLPVCAYQRHRNVSPRNKCSGLLRCQSARNLRGRNRWLVYIACFYEAALVTAESLCPAVT